MAHITMTHDFRTAFDAYVASLQKMIDKYLADHNYQWEETVGYDEGGKYMRVWVRKSNGSRSSHTFIEKNTGAIFKCASWKAPAKHVRGNIFAAEPLAGVDVHGAKYL